MTIQNGAASEKLEGAALVHSLKKRLGTAALAGALIPLAAAGLATDAAAQVEEPQRPVDPLGRLSHVEGSVDAEAGQFRYSFEVFNRTPLTFIPDSGGGSGSGTFQGGFHTIVDWELPLFSLNGISDIRSPESWTFEIIRQNGEIVASDPDFDNDQNNDGFSDVYGADLNNAPYGEYAWDWRTDNDPVFFDDPDVYGPNPDQFVNPNLILHWYAIPLIFDLGDDVQFVLAPGAIFEQESLDEFSFLAADSATNAPYQASWFEEPQTIGDPPTPQGANSGVPIGVPNNATVPEPGMLALFATGLLGLIGLRRRRQSV